jgi:hypothetical protein
MPKRRQTIPIAHADDVAPVTHVDNQTLQSAKVSISSGFLTGDVLSANVAGTSITASYDPTTGVLTLTGNDTLVHYRQVLDSVTYNSTSSNPTNFGADTNRTISWVVNDGTLNSATQTTTLTIPAQGAAPVLGNMTATIAFTNEQWQAIEHAYGRQLNTEVRQQITTVTTQYLKDCGFERTAAPKAMAWERIERIRRAAGDLEKVMLDSKPLSASTDELSREQRQSGHSYADGLIRRHLAGSASSDELSSQQSDAHSYADGLIRRYLDEQSLARDKLHHFRDALKSLIVACDCALNDLSAAEYCDDEPWDLWIQRLTRIAQEHHVPYGARIVERIVERSEPSPFVALVRALQEHVPARHTLSCEALAKAIRRAQRRAGDK